MESDIEKKHLLMKLFKFKESSNDDDLISNDIEIVSSNLKENFGKQKEQEYNDEKRDDNLNFKNPKLDENNMNIVANSTKIQNDQKKLALKKSNSEPKKNNSLKSINSQTKSTQSLSRPSSKPPIPSVKANNNLVKSSPVRIEKSSNKPTPLPRTSVNNTNFKKSETEINLKTKIAQSPTQSPKISSNLHKFQRVAKINMMFGLKKNSNSKLNELKVDGQNHVNGSTTNITKKESNERIFTPEFIQENMNDINLKSVSSSSILIEEISSLKKNLEIMSSQLEKILSENLEFRKELNELKQVILKINKPEKD